MVGFTAPRTANAHRRKGRLRRALATTAAVALGMLGMAAGTSAAQAAELPVTFSNQSLTQGGQPVSEIEVLPYSSLRFSTDFTLASQPQAGDTFTVPIDLSGGLFGMSGTSFVLNNANGQAAADCVYTEGTGIACTFRSPVPVGTGATGDLWFNIHATKDAEATTAQVQVGGVYFDVTVKEGGGGTGPTTDNSTKSGGQYGSEGAIWVVYISNADLARFHQMGTIEFADSLRSGSDSRFIYMPQQYDPATLTVDCVPGINGAALSSFIPVGLSWSDTSFGFELSPQEVDQCLAQGGGFKTQYRTSVPGGIIKNDPEGPRPWFGYGNDAEVNGEKLHYTVNATADGGGGMSAEVAVVMVEKELTGDGAELADGQTFSVRAQYGVEDRTVSVVAGNASAIGQVPVNTPVTLSEVNLPQIEGVEWGDYTFEGEGVVDNGDGTFTFTPTQGGQTVTLKLVNVATEDEPSDDEATDDEATEAETEAEAETTEATETEAEAEAEAEATETDATEAEATETEAEATEADADATEADATETEATETEADGTDATETEATEADATETEAEADAAEAEADSTDADATEADAEATESEATETDAEATEADATEADATEADANEAEATETEATEAETEATEADATETDATESEAAETEADAAEASDSSDAADSSEADASEASDSNGGNTQLSRTGADQPIAAAAIGALLLLVGATVLLKRRRAADHE